MTAPLPTSQSTNLPAAAAYQSTNPYVGPRTFETADRQRYFGREAEAASLLGRVISERLLLFYAQSGAGKSSLLNARLIPALREEEGFSVLPVARVAGALPTGVAQVENIFLFNLMASLDRAAADPGRFAGLGLAGFLEHLVTEDGVAWRYDPAAGAGVEEAPAAAEPAGRFALIVDQFEEIITGHPERWQEREEFFCQLDAALQANPNLWVVLTLREDYVAALDPYAPLVFNRLRARFYMERMDGAAALEAIRRPAELGGRPFAASVAEQLVDNLRQVRVPGQGTTVPGQYVEPVQLQVVCFQLWKNLERETRRTEETESVGPPNPSNPPNPSHPSNHPALQITFADLAAAGNVDQALTAFYEETLAAALADPAAAGVSERQVRAWFDEQLITEASTRGLVHQGEWESGGLPNGVVRALQRRFLVRGEARGGDVWIELVHDRFVEPIRANNAAWFTRNLSALQRQTALWIEQGRPFGLLLRDATLAEAEAWAASHPEEVGNDERQFLDASRQAQQALERKRRDSRHIRLLALGATIVAVVAFVAAVFGVTGQQQARTAEQTAVAQATRALNAEATAVSERVVAQAAEATAVAERSRADAEAKVAENQRVIAEQKAIEAEQEKQRAEAQARHAQAGELAAHAQYVIANDKNDPSLALLLAIQAVEVTWQAPEHAVTVAADAALRDTVDAAPPYVMTLLHPRSTESVVDSVTSAAYSPDGTTIVTTSTDGTARVWDAATGEEVRTFTDHNGNVARAVPSPDGAQIFTVTSDGTARIWDAATGQEVRTLSGHSGYVVSAAWSPDGRLIVTAGCDRINADNPSCQEGSARIWDTANGQEVQTLSGHSGWVMSVDWSPDGRLIVTAGCDRIRADNGTCQEGSARIWDTANGQKVRTLSGDFGIVWSAAYSPDGSQIVTGGCSRVDAEYRYCQEGSARIWDAATGEAVRSLSGHSREVVSATYSPDGGQIVTASGDRTARIWDAASGQELRTLSGHNDYVNSAAWSPDGLRIVTASSDGTARVWGNLSGQRVYILIGHSSWVSSAAYSPDGSQIVTTSGDTTARVWDAASGQELRTLSGHNDNVNSAAWSPDGLHIVTASDDGTARIWDAASGEEMRTLSGFRYVYSAAWSPDGRQIVTASAYEYARVWDAESAQEVRTFGEHNWMPISVAWSPNGRQIVTAHVDGATVIWDATSGQELHTLSGHSARVTSVAWSPEGSQIVTASEDRTARIWDATSGQELHTLSGHSASVTSVAWSPDGRQIVTASWDRTARIWDASTGREMRILSSHSALLESVAWSPDGKMIVTAGLDGTARTWIASIDDLLAEAARLIQRDPPLLTPEERQRYGLE